MERKYKALIMYIIIILFSVFLFSTRGEIVFEVENCIDSNGYKIIDQFCEVPTFPNALIELETGFLIIFPLTIFVIIYFFYALSKEEEEEEKGEIK